ncbi:hypothetical protein M011DRAFT_491810 [Sporormia fimetaria CBS 119925]|uniref:Zn(2)-C6 fungal-type domain-containing protein n=1 Tax=Sporormia fimetaria CBS 119925 TaxID=1340428 RepID=A0A6A6VL00_9PLEO|nr:hypothetical protein M011DRAFT_491810 [Sporormia fimetaria CBS 119925]
MDAVEDELDVRYHRGLKPDVYYRCPTLESLDGALQNELQKNAASFIPVEIITEFVFAAASTITVPATQQTNLGALAILPAEYPQSITVQRAIARSVIDVVQAIDDFKYTERQAVNKEGSDGVRFKYVSNEKKDGNQSAPTNSRIHTLPTYDCGGAVFIKFSTKRDAINVVYKHNPIHRDVKKRGRPKKSRDDAESDPSQRPKQKRGRPKKDRDDFQVPDRYAAAQMDMFTSPEDSRASIPGKTASKKKKKGKQAGSLPTENAASPPAAAAKPMKGPCIRCREKQIKCDQTKPTCNQCSRGLWQCFYELTRPMKRSKSGCYQCKQRKRKCSEEKPLCAYCLKVDDDCEYPE